METVTWGTLEALWAKSGPRATRGAVILLHGYGADMHDLAPLVQGLPQAAQTWDWCFPNAPLGFPGNSPGRAWFPLDPLLLSQLLAAEPVEVPPPEVDAALEALGSLVQEVRRRYSRVALGGFSQGAMLALDWALSFPQNIDRLILLSAAWVGHSGQKLHPPPSFPVFQSHGSFDPVLPLDAGLRLKRTLEGAGVALEYHQFAGGHQIPAEILHRLDGFLEKHHGPT